MIKKMESKEYALGVERMDKEVGAPIDIAQSPMLMADKYENADFIASDPVQFPRRYSGRDAEVSGFITSWLSFGNRKAIIGAAEMRKCLDKIFDLAIDERLK